MITFVTGTMSIIRMLLSPAAVFLTIASCVAGAPLQIEGENIGLGQAVYSQPELAEALARTYEALGDPEARRLNAITSGLPMRSSRRSLESLSGATFNENKRCNPHSSRRQNELADQNGNWRGITNFNEIDHTGLDPFQKRNVDEIDRTGWDSFKKRRSMDAYRASRQR